MKRKISLLLIVTVLMTMAIPSVSLAETLGTSVVADNEYYYEDFESYTGASGWFDTASTNGYYSAAGTIFSNFSDDKKGTGLKIVNKTTSFKSFNGPRGNADTYFDVSTEQFEDVGTTLVFTADVLIKDTLSVNGSGLYINLHALKDDWQNLNSTLHSISALPMYTKHWSKGATFFVPIQAAGNTQAGWTGGNATDFVTTTKVDGSSWVKLTSVVTYDKENQKYVTTSYVDGKPIYNETSKEISKLEVPAPSDDVAERTRFGISVNYRANNTDTTKDEYAVVDNLAMYLCDTAVPQTGTVSGKTITIPFKNGKTFTDVSTAPDVVTNGYLNVDTVKNATLTTEDGTAIDGAVITATQSEIKVTVPAGIGSGKVKVDLTGVEDIAGNQVELDTSEYTVSGGVNIENTSYYQDFEGITALSEVGYNPVNISSDDTNKTFVLATTAAKGNGIAVNYTAASSSKSVTAPDANATYGFSVDAAAFETAGKELEYGYDVFIPGGAYKGEALAGYLLFKKADGSVIQYCSELPWLTNTDNTNPNLKFRAINDDSIASDWTATNNNIFTANGKPGVDQRNNSVYVDYAETEDGGWVSIKSRVSYIKDTDGTGYYITKYYVNGEVICNSDGSPAKFKIQENLVPENSERKYLQFSLYGNIGENNVNKIVVDNIFVNVVEAEEEEELPTPPNPPIQDADEELYYYEDFNSYTGASDWFNTGSTNGYNSNSGDIFSVYSDDKNGTSLKIVNKTTSFKGFNGPRGNADAYFDVSTAQFEDAGATLVFTADVLIKDSLSKDSSGLYINLHALKGDWQKLNSTLYSISALPMYTKHWQKGAMFFVPIQAAGNTQAG